MKRPLSLSVLIFAHLFFFELCSCLFDIANALKASQQCLINERNVIEFLSLALSSNFCFKLLVLELFE